MKDWFLDPQPFVAYGTSHAVVSLIIVVVLVAMCAVARGKAPRLGVGSQIERRQALTMAVILLLAWPFKVWAFRMMGVVSGAEVKFVLPMHLCDWAGIAGAIALIRRRPLAAELVYFWGLAGTLNGLLTPDLGQNFPHPRFFVFFALHGGVVITSFYVVIGLRLKPRPGAVWRMFAWTQLYVLAAVVVNLLTRNSSVMESNYGFLLHKPVDANNPLLNALGPWPWYVIGLQGVCLTAFFLLNLPFWLARRKAQLRIGA